MNTGVHDGCAATDDKPGDGERRGPEFDTERVLVLVSPRVYEAVHLFIAD